MEATISATLYKRPRGDKEQITVTHVRPDAAAYINDNNIKVSMEDTGMDFAIYFDDGAELDDGTPDEIIIIAGGKSCEDCMDSGVEILKRRKAKGEAP